METVISKYNYTVYRHTTPSGKVYIGITCQPPSHRWYHGKGYMNTLKSPFKSSILKYGWDNIQHEVLATNLGEMTAKNMEKDFIKFYKQRGISLNITDGGDGCNGIIPWNKGMKDCSGMFGPRKGVPLTEEHKQALRKPHGGNSRWRKGIKLSDEEKLALSASHLGFKVSETTKQKISENSAMAKPVRMTNITTGEVLTFPSLIKLAIHLGLKNPNNLRKRCNDGQLYKKQFKLEWDG